jgi:putative peptidoglycan lipid II flippase
MKGNPLQKLIKSSAFIIAATVILKSLGLLREIILAYAYGAGTVTDAYVIARSVPDTFVGILTGSAGAVFITICASISAKGENSGEKTAFSRNIISVFGLIGVLLTLVFAVFPSFFVRLFAMNIDPETAKTAAAMLRLMSLVCVPNFVSTFLAANLQMKKRFFRAAIYQVTINVSIISFIFIGRATGADVLIGAGFAVGCVLSALLLIIFNKSIDFTYRPFLNFRDPALRAFVLLIIPSVLSIFIMQLFQVIDRNMASSFDVGTVSAMNYATKIVNVFSALIGTTVATAFLPDLTKYAAADDREKMSEQIGDALKTVIPIALPLTLGIIILARPIVQILLERGEFGAGETDITAALFLMYTVGLLPQCIAPIFSYIFLAKKDTKTLLFISSMTLIAGIALNFILIKPMGANGLALATSLAAYFSLGMYFLIFRHRKIRFGVFRQRREWVKLIAAAASMSLFAAFGGSLFTGGSYLHNLAATAAVAVISVIIYAGILFITKSETADVYIALIKSIFSRKKEAKPE